MLKQSVYEISVAVIRFSTVHVGCLINIIMFVSKPTTHSKREKVSLTLLWLSVAAE